ncbi:MAG: GreA/GreB family elongation factor [Candidatus Shapirobacteria bacterium]|jgi:transcription elongation factor GreA
MNKTMLTQAGFVQLDSQLSDLNEKKERLITQIEEVALPDESGEDSLCSQLKEELEVVNDKITKLEEALENAEIVTNGGSKTLIQVGSKVKVKLSGNSTKEFAIVSHLESDPSLNKISDQSPLGQALLGKKINDEFEIVAPVGKIAYKIIAIS